MCGVGFNQTARREAPTKKRVRSANELIRVQTDRLALIPTLSLGEQRYLILECKVWIFKDVVHQDDEFAHDSRQSQFGGFARLAQSLVKGF